MFSRNSQARLRTSLYKPIFKLEPLPSRASNSYRSISLQLQYSRKPNNKLVLFVYHSREKWPLLLDEFGACQPGTFLFSSIIPNVVSKALTTRAEACQHDCLSALDAIRWQGQACSLTAYQMKRIGNHPCSCLLRSFALGCRHLQTLKLEFRHYLTTLILNKN